MSLFDMLVVSSQWTFFIKSQKWCQQVIQTLIVNNTGADAEEKTLKTD